MEIKVMVRRECPYNGANHELVTLSKEDIENLAIEELKKTYSDNHGCDFSASDRTRCPTHKY